MQYAFDGKSGRYTALAPASVATGAGYGPRHLRVSPDNRFVYVLCELTGHVVQFERRAERCAGRHRRGAVGTAGIRARPRRAARSRLERNQRRRALCMVRRPRHHARWPVPLCHRAHHLVDRLPVDRQGVGRIALRRHRFDRNPATRHPPHVRRQVPGGFRRAVGSTGRAPHRYRLPASCRSPAVTPAAAAPTGSRS